MASRVIEEKIVKFGIDNKQFLKGLNEASKGLTELESGMEKTSDGSMWDRFKAGVSNITSAISGFLGKFVPGFLKSKESVDALDPSLRTASSGVDKLGQATSTASKGFSILAGAASVALGNIATSAMRTGLQMTKHLTIDPVKAGFSQYEKRIETMNMMVAALGEDQTDNIQAKLKELQDYAQTTRYSVAQMHSSLGAFVNAGIDIDRASVALKGWGNLAASAGASTDGFNTSLKFGVQQALAMGYMNLQNWMSVENANMNTQKFQKLLLEVAKDQGKMVDESVGFRETLKDKWLDNNVLMEALRRLSEDPTLVEMASKFHTLGEAMEAVAEASETAWSGVFESLIGKAGSKEVTEMWTNFGNALSSAVEFIPLQLSKVAEKFVELGGRASLFQTVVSIFKSFKMVLDAIGDAFNVVFPDAVGTTAKLLADAFAYLAETMKPTEALGIAVREIFIAIFTVLKAGLGVIGLVIKALAVLIPDNLIQDVIIIVGWFATMFNGIIKGSKTLAGSFFGSGAFAAAMRIVAAVVNAVWGALHKLVVMIQGGLIDAWDALNKSLGKFVNESSAVQGVSKLFGKLGDALSKIADKIGPALTKFFDGLLKGLGEIAVALGGALLSGLEFFLTITLELVDGLQWLVTAIWDFVSATVGQLIPGLDESMDGMNSFSEVVGFLGGLLKDGLIWSIERLGEMFKWLAEHTTTLATTIGDKLNPVFSALSEFLKPVTDALGDFFGAIKDGVGNFLFGETAYADEIGEIGERAKTSTPKVDGLRGALSKLATNFNNLTVVQKVKGFFSGLFAEIGKWQITQNLAKGLKAVWEWFKKLDIVGKVTEGFNKFFDSIKNVGLLTTLKNALSGIGDSIGKVFTTLKSLIPSWGDLQNGLEKLGLSFASFGKILRNFGSVIPGTLGKLITLFGTLFGSVKVSADELDGAGTTTQAAADKIQRSLSPLTIVFNAVKDVFSGMIEGIKKVNGDEPIDTIYKIGMLGSILYLAKNFGRITKSFVGIGDGLKNLLSIPTNFGASAIKTLDEVRDTLKSYQTKLRSEAFFNIAKGLLVMAAAFWVMAQIPADKVRQVLVMTAAGLFMLVLAMAAIQVVQSKFPSHKNGILGSIFKGLGLEQIGKGVKLLGGALALVAIIYAVNKVVGLLDVLADANWGKYMDGIGKLSIIIGILVGAVKLAGSGGFGSAIAFVGIVLAVKMMIELTRQVAILVSVYKGDLWAAVGIVSLLMIVMGLMAKFSGRDASQKGAGLTFIAMALSIKLLAGVVKQLGEMKTGQAIQGGLAVSTLMIVLGGVVVAINKLGGTSPSLGSAFQILALAISLRLIIGAIEPLGKMNLNELVQGLVGVTVILTVLGAVSIAMSKFGKGAPMSTIPILGLVLGLYVVLWAVKKIGETDPETLQNGLTFVAGILLSLAGITYLISKIKVDTSTTATLMTLLGAIVAIPIALLVLKNIKWDDVKEGILAMGVVLLMLVSAFAIVAFVNKATDLNAVYALGVLVVALIVVSASLLLLKGVSWNELWPAVAAISIVLLVLAGAFAIIATTVKATNKNAIYVLGVLVAALLVAALSIALLTLLPTGKMLTAAIALVAVIAVVGLVFAAVIKAMKQPNKNAVIMMGEMIALIAVVALSLVALAQVDWNKLTVAAIALSAVIAVIGLVFIQITKATKNVNKNQVAIFGEMVALVAVVGVSLSLLAKYDWKKLATASLALVGTLYGVSKVFEQITKTTGKTSKNDMIIFAELIAGVAVVAWSLSEVAKHDWTGILAGAVGISAVLLAMAASFKIIVESTGDVTKEDMILYGEITASVAVIALSLSELAKHDWESTLASAVGVSAVLLAMGYVFKQVVESTGDVTKEDMILYGEITASVAVIALSLSELAKHDWESIAAAALGVDSVLYTMATVFKKIKESNGNITKEDMILFGELILAVQQSADALAKVAKYEWDNILSAAGAIDSVLFTMGAVFKSIKRASGKVTKEDAIMVGTLILSVDRIGESLSKVAKYDWDSILSAAIAIDTTMGVMGLVFMGISKCAGAVTIKDAFMVLSLAVSVWIIADALKKMTTVDWGTLGLALTSFLSITILLGLVAAALGAFAAFTGPGVAILLALAAAVWVLAEAMLVFATAIDVWVGALTKGWELVKDVVEQLIEWFQRFIDYIQNGEMGEAFEAIGELFSGLGELIMSGVEALPGILLELGSNIVQWLIDGIVFMFWTFPQKLWELLTTGVQKLAEGLPKFLEKGGEFVSNIVSGIAGFMARVPSKLWEMIVSAINKLAEALPEFLKKGKEFVGKIVSGITNKISDIVKEAKNLGDKFMEEIKKVPDKAYKAGKEIVQKIIDGISNMAQKAWKEVENLVGGLLDLLPNSPAKKGPLSGRGWTKITKVGQAIVDPIAKGLKKHGRGAVKVAEGMIGDIADSMSYINRDFGMSISPTVTPVLNESKMNSRIFDVLTSSPDINVNRLNSNTLQAELTNTRLNDMADGISMMNSQLTQLQAINESQARLLDEGKIVVANMDGQLVSDALAPTMTQSQAAYNARLNRIGGIR